jgi:hypothetical protein
LNPYLEIGLIVGSNVLVAAFFYGRLTQKVNDLGGWLKRHEGEIVKHGDQLLDHEGRISHVEARVGLPRGVEN